MLCIDANFDVFNTRAVVSYDEYALRDGQLTDIHIDFANNMLRLQYGHISGLDTPLLCQTRTGFSPASKLSSVVQIHHFDGHWITSFRAANNDAVYVYDSLSSRSIAPELIRQLRQLYTTGGEKLAVHCPSVTQQTNGSDCGVFAIAFAIDLCAGYDPSLREYDRRELRPHIIRCFRNSLLEQFPTVGERTQHTNSFYITQ